MNILVTGGGGYLGTVLVRQLLRRHRVTVLDRFSWGTQPLASVAGPSLWVISGHVQNASLLAAALSGIDLVVHLAAVVGYPACDADPEDADSTNVKGTRLLCSRLEGRPIIFASTGSCYGKVDGIATEKTPLSPLTRYGRNKVRGEELVLGVGGTVLRFATLFGLSPRMRWDLLPNDFVRRGVSGSLAVFDPTARRTFLHVEDAASAIASMIPSSVLNNGVYNVGDPQLNLTKGTVAEQVRALTHCTLVHTMGQDPDQRDYAVCYDRIGLTGWRANHLLELDDVVQFARVWR